MKWNLRSFKTSKSNLRVLQCNLRHHSLREAETRKILISERR